MCPIVTAQFCALLGAACVPLVLLTVWDLTQSLSAATIAACFVMLGEYMWCNGCFESLLALSCVSIADVMHADSSCITLSRFILLDPILLFFICLSIHAVLHLHLLQQRQQQCTARWWVYLALTGIALSCAASSKWVGVFVVAFAGAVTVS